ncbi:hypothetical protein CW304_12200 [Bacillus sp. UFRGS-B20]|nr:hypothetical protein CW304_12200 [Bacillus sp. UFRGS-B20]
MRSFLKPFFILLNSKCSCVMSMFELNILPVHKLFHPYEKLYNLNPLSKNILKKSRITNNTVVSFPNLQKSLPGNRYYSFALRSVFCKNVLRLLYNM